MTLPLLPNTQGTRQRGSLLILVAKCDFRLILQVPNHAAKGWCSKYLSVCLPTFYFYTYIHIRFNILNVNILNRNSVNSLKLYKDIIKQSLE